MTFRLVIAILMLAIEYFFGVVSVIVAIKSVKENGYANDDYKEYYNMMWLFAIVSIITFFIASI